MKTKLVFPLLGIVLLLTAVSCTDPVEVNPNYNPETNEVLAKFVLNVSTQAPSTKQSAAVVQADNQVAFRGVTDGILLTKVLADEPGAGTRGGIMIKDAVMDKEYKITNAVDASTSIINGSARRVYEWSLPLKTDLALFYGRSPQGDISSTADYTKDDYFGALSQFSVGREKGSTNIQLKKRLESSDDLTKVERVLSSLLTSIMATKIQGDGQGEEFIVDGFSFDGSYATFTEEHHGYPTIWWSDFAQKSGTDFISPLNHDLASPLEIKLANVYSAMMVVREHELRAASGEAILRTIYDLWSTVKEVKNASAATSYQEAMAKQFATIIHERLTMYFEETTGFLPLDFKTIGTIASNLINDIHSNGYWPEKGLSKRPASTDITIPASSYRELVKFPFNFNLPRGAVHMKIYNVEDDASTTEVNEEIKEVFYFPDQFDTSDMGTTGTYNANDYYYPAPLIYFANSPLYTSNNEISASNYPGGSADKLWTNISSWTGWETGEQGFVKASTHAVALKDEVNYGVALLETKVKFERTNAERKLLTDEDGEYILDNNHAIQLLNNPSLGTTEEPDNKIHVTNDSFELTGIIIGGQYIDLDWDCLPYKRTDITGRTASKQGFIYDKIIEEGSISGESSDYKPTYTVVFDNFEGIFGSNGMYTVQTNTTSGQSTISVALEFRNNTGKDFYGNANLIRNGGYFYLIGALNPEGKTISSWPTNHVVPPYTSTGGSMKITRVFIQDFVTSATFSFGRESLHAAYLTVPDLRSSSLTLGLSVDTSWSTGLSFENVVLGE